MKTVSSAAVALVVSCLVTGCSHAPLSSLPLNRAGSYDASLEHGGFTRNVRVHLPTASGPRPLLIALHGGGSNGGEMEAVTGFSRIADREGFVVAYPDGVGGPHGFIRLWNAGSCCGMPMMLGVDDVGFIRFIADDLIARAHVDPARVYLVGYSAGGAMVHRLATTMSERFAAAAIYAATMPATGPIEGPRIELPAPNPPISIMLLHSYADPRVSYAGHERFDTTEASFLHGGQFYASAAGCREQPQTVVGSAGAARRLQYRHCDSGAEVELVTLYGWDHEWPGPANIHGCRSAGEPLHDFDGAELIWGFFADKVRSSLTIRPSASTSPGSSR